jgi:RNA polymerase sigma-70 factor (ECF subfamily)
MRSEPDIERTIDSHGNTIWRVCTLYFGQSADAQDAFQETLFKYALSTTDFKEEEHRKAWLIRVVTNVCKDMLKAAHRRTGSLDEEGENGLIMQVAAKDTENTFREVLAAIQGLTDPPRTPVYLALYEGYTAPEIATLLEAPVNTVYSWIARGKQELREALR